MGNYSILFDFDGENFIFMEILGEDKRNICSVNLISNNKENNISIPIDKDFGQMLHAEEIGFIHPITKEYLDFKVDPPKRFMEILEIYKNKE